MLLKNAHNDVHINLRQGGQITFFSRLNTEAGGGAWCPKSQIDNAVDGAEYLEIDLLSDHIVRNVNHIKDLRFEFAAKPLLIYFAFLTLKFIFTIAY